MARRLADRRAMAAVEFAIVGPVFLLLLFGIMGVGLDGFYQLALDDAVRDAARQIQINGPAAATSAGFVAAVCQEFGGLARHCTTTLTYNITASTPTGGFSALTPAALPANGKFGDSFFGTGASYAKNENVLVQVAYPLPFALPYVATLITATGTQSIVAATVVRVEPWA